MDRVSADNNILAKINYDIWGVCFAEELFTSAWVSGANTRLFSILNSGLSDSEIIAALQTLSRLENCEMLTRNSFKRDLTANVLSAFACLEEQERDCVASKRLTSLEVANSAAASSFLEYSHHLSD